MPDKNLPTFPFFVSPREAKKVSLSIAAGQLQIDGPRETVEKIARHLEILGAEVKGKSPYGPLEKKRPKA